MKLTGPQIKSREIIGHLENRPVHMIESIGGLHLIVMMKNGNLETLGVGPHRAVAMFVAEKKEPDIVWSEYLTKSGEDLPCPTCKQKDDLDHCLCVLRWEHGEK